MNKPAKNRNVTEQIYSDYSKSLEEANQRYGKYKEKDCFPKIAPALLNSADIKAYIKQTGMIYPFYEDDLQSASYKVRISGKVVYWEYGDLNSGKKNKKINKCEKELSEGECFDLQPNSIAFVTLEPEFHIPKYLALRFNLKITHIYKGLLLGTGPLVDPGFEGRLSIPLHNLTNNTYRFRNGDTLITMEFTKLSPNKEWINTCENVGHSESYQFEKIKSSRDVNEYINNALKFDRLDSIISSIPDSIYESKKQAREARKDVEKVKKNSNIITIGSLVSVCAVVVSSIVFFSKTIDRYDKIKEDNGKYMYEISALHDQIDSLNKEILKLEEKIEEIGKEKIEFNSIDSGVN